LYSRGKTYAKAKKAKANRPHCSLTLVFIIGSGQHENVLTKHIAEDRHLERGAKTSNHSYHSQPLWLILAHYVFETDIAVNQFLFGCFLGLECKYSGLGTARD